MDYAKTLKPVFDRHEIPESLKAEIIRYFEALDPKSPELDRLTRTKKWSSFLREARITVSQQFLEEQFHGKRLPRKADHGRLPSRVPRSARQQAVAEQDGRRSDRREQRRSSVDR